MAPVLATLIILAGLAIFTWIISYRVRPLLFARKDVRWDDPATRTEKLLLYGIGQGRMPTKPDRPAGVAPLRILLALIGAPPGAPPSLRLAHDPGVPLPLLAHQALARQLYPSG